MWEDYFSVQIFFIILRETLESAIIVSVLLSFLKQNFGSEDPKTYKSLQFQIWFGALLGMLICLAIGGAMIAIFYFLGNDLWSLAERIWEGVFSIISAVIISIMGLALLRINHLQTKWKSKLGRSFTLKNLDDIIIGDTDVAQLSRVGKIRYKVKLFTEKHALALLPFITTMREGLEAVVFIGGIGVSQPFTSFPLAILAGGATGFFVGWIMYRGGNKMQLQYFLILSTAFLYLVASGLMSRGVWFLELERYVQLCDGQDMSEVGSGPGSYDVSNSVWHVNCCNGLTDGGWMLLNALVGWTNSATYGSVISYIAFWVFIVASLKVRLFRERNGYLPFIPFSWQKRRIRKQIGILKRAISTADDQYSEVNSEGRPSLTQQTETTVSGNEIEDGERDTLLS
ncbi:hypothetical protein LJB42_003331 [Komagataella kurtzmanii]|nr:hypothetical protein LJB42_003331 [Komagataella kurtzmanii]